MPKLVCINCEVEMKTEQNGVFVAEMFQDNAKIYKIWHADMWKCPLCDYEVISGFGFSPLANHFDRDLEEWVKELKAKGEVVVYDKELL